MLTYKFPPQLGNSSIFSLLIYLGFSKILDSAAGQSNKVIIGALASNFFFSIFFSASMSNMWQLMNIV
jgi:hypothetical protein